MIDEDKGLGFDARCDGCLIGYARILGHEAKTFKEVVEHLKREGWTIVMVNLDWRHFCPGCTAAREIGGKQKEMPLIGGRAR